MFEEWHARPIPGGPERAVTVPGKPAALAGADGVTYRTSFTDPREPDEDVAVVVLCGLYAGAEIEVSADRLDGDGPITSDAYFEPVRVPIHPDAETDLTVTCHAPQDRFGGLYDTDRVPASERVPGIWWDAVVETHPLPYVDRVQVSPEMTDEGAALHVRTTVVTGGPLEDRITFSLRPTGGGGRRASAMMNRETVSADGPGRTTVQHTIDLRDPSPWWPRDLGDQHRYTLRAKLGDSERSVTTGLCSVTREGGRLRINGQPMQVRGVNLLTDDPADVERAADLHANLVRAPAHVLSPAVYEACDEAGLVVWQGLPLTGPGAFDVDRGHDLATRLVDTYGRHPSLGPIGVHDEPTDTFADGLGDGFLDRLRLRWRAWRVAYDGSPAERVAEALGEETPVVPVVACPGVTHDAAAYYPGWDYSSAEDIEGLLDRYPADLLAAFGAGALAEEGSREAAGFDATKHDARVDGGVAASQAYQADVLRTIAETARRRGAGVVATALRDADAAGMGVYAADGTPKAAREELARALQPVQAFLVDPSPGETAAVVVNDAPESLSVTLSWAAGDAGGERDLSVKAAGRWHGTVDLPAAETVTLRVSVGDATVENTYEL